VFNSVGLAVEDIAAAKLVHEADRRREAEAAIRTAP
jgi:ornithine cyclodeaminase/alanine dehydrogenase-like protein (mu-crystallin family)